MLAGVPEALRMVARFPSRVDGALLKYDGRELSLSLPKPVEEHVVGLAESLARIAALGDDPPPAVYRTVREEDGA